MPKVSVLMPVYQTKESYLREAIESILNQTYTDFEFLILDDCPENSRESVVKSYTDQRIKYVQNEHNLGITPSRNRLIDMATGEYLAVFDHDDVSLPARLEKQVQYLDSHLEVGVVGTKLKTINKQKISALPTNDSDIKLGLMGGCMLAHSSVMIRRKLLIENNIRYEKEFSPSEDYALFGRLLPFTQFHNLNDEVLFHYRDHKENTSHLQFNKMRQATAAIWAFLKFQNPLLYETFILQSEKTHYWRLFGIIPFLTIRKRSTFIKVYLFGKILILNAKVRVRL